jgi:hypothetical protein
MTDEELTLRTLHTVPIEISAALLRLTAARERRNPARNAVEQARQATDVQRDAATMVAYAGGLLTGKNQTERDVQLNVALANDASLAAAVSIQHAAELAETSAELAVEALEGEVKALTWRLQAAIAAAGLLAEMVKVRALAAEATPQVQRDGAMAVGWDRTRADDPMFR